MATTAVTGAVTGRHQQVCYIKGGDISDYALMAVFTEHNEKPGAQTVDKKYTVNKSKTKTVGSYEWEMGFTGDIIKSDAVMKDFVDIGRTMKVGADCKRTLCMVDLDEDEMRHFIQDTFDNCPYYRPGDEYSIVRHQN